MVLDSNSDCMSSVVTVFYGERSIVSLFTDSIYFGESLAACVSCLSGLMNLQP